MNDSFETWILINSIDEDIEKHIRDVASLLKRKELTQRQAEVVLEGVKVLLKESKV